MLSTPEPLFMLRCGPGAMFAVKKCRAGFPGCRLRRLSSCLREWCKKFVNRSIQRAGKPTELAGAKACPTRWISICSVAMRVSEGRQLPRFLNPFQSFQNTSVQLRAILTEAVIR